ncbi:RNA-binding protein S1 [Aerococcaceae bacterium DSM 111176]|nr:RNA-binding protein S1 [Aerococcaceae bacterium DSM 111176]
MSIEVGQKIEGTVSSVKNFGAFVNLENNQSGMIHISEVSDGFIKDINDFLTAGDTVTVKVIKITDDGKINLSLRQASENAAPKEERNQKPVQEKPAYQKKPAFKQQAKPAFKPAAQESNDTDDFDKMMSRFLKDSEDNLSSLRRNTEGKRGGRGGRRK